MPFQSFKATLNPATMQTAQQAFDLAWTELIADPDGQNIQLARDSLAKRIIEAALESNERDPNRLKAYALEGLKP